MTNALGSSPRCQHTGFVATDEFRNVVRAGCHAHGHRYDGYERLDVLRGVAIISNLWEDTLLSPDHSGYDKSFRLPWNRLKPRTPTRSRRPIPLALGVRFTP
jgi:hypothetical protein